MIYEGDFNLADLESTLNWATKELEKARAKKRKIGLLSIAQPDSKMDSKLRSYAANWLKEQNELLRFAAVGHAVVVSNPIQRGVLTAILWLGDYSIPIRAFGTDAEARRWLVGTISSLEATG
ncbi:MAG: hypothetical protein GXY23_11595 [Myxococcales bacterium]|nr:hypothetical protein [Myxococcales bacterium]